MPEKIKLLHCWELGPKGESTCLLPIDHDGPCVFTPNEKVGFSLFKRFRGE